MSDLKLNYRVDGDGEPLLLVHGFGISFNIWKNLIPLLRPHFTLVMIEAPGIGGSPFEKNGRSYLAASVEAIECLRTKLGFDSWNVLGYSTGSRIAEAYGGAYVSRVRGLIFLCPLVLPRFTNLNLRISLWVDKFIPAYGDFILTGWRLKFLILLLGFSLKQNPLAGEWFDEISQNPRNVLKETLRMVAPFGTRPFDVPKSALHIWGRDDFVTQKPRKPGPHDFFIYANHAAPMLAADEVSELIIKLLGNS